VCGEGAKDFMDRRGRIRHVTLGTRRCTEYGNTLGGNQRIDEPDTHKQRLANGLWRGCEMAGKRDFSCPDNLKKTVCPPPRRDERCSFGVADWGRVLT
jgi:hypothetical protein